MKFDNPIFKVYSINLTNLTKWLPKKDPHHQEADGLIRNFRFDTWETIDCDVPDCPTTCGKTSGPEILKWTNDNADFATVTTFGGDWSNYYTPNFINNDPKPGWKIIRIILNE